MTNLLPLGLAAGYLVLVVLIACWGNRLDILAGGLFVSGSWVAVAAHLLKLPSVLVVSFVVSMVLFLSFWLIAERAQRWWIVGLAGFQLMALISYLAPIYSWDRLREAFVLFHWTVGVANLGCLALGLVETRWARSTVAGQADGSDLDLRNRP